MFCQYCGTRLPEDAVFCEACGARVPQPAAPVQERPAAPVQEAPAAPAQEAPVYQTWGEPFDPTQAQPAPPAPAQEAPVFQTWEEPYAPAPDQTAPSASVQESPVFQTWGEPYDPAPVQTAPPAPPRQKPSPNIELCEDGVYRWIYEFSMMKNPVILFTILKIFGIAALFIFGLGLIFSIGDSGTLGEKLWIAAMPALIALAIIGVLLIPSYLIVAKMYGWKYIVRFEMDDAGIDATQEPKQYTKAQGLAWLTVMAGLAGKSPGAVGAGMLAGSRSGMTSDFAKVRSVKVLRRWHTIKVNQPFAKNQIYAEPEDFDFVLNYILARVPEKAKKRV